MAADLPEALLRQLNPAQIRWYAVQAGWKPVEGIKRPVIVLNHPTDELTQLQIPTAGSERERAYLMGEAVRQLAETERRAALEILNDLTALHADSIRLQVESRYAEAGTLPLPEGLSLIQAGRDLLLAAARKCRARCRVGWPLPAWNFPSCARPVAGCARVSGRIANGSKAPF